MPIAEVKLAAKAAWVTARWFVLAALVAGAFVGGCAWKGGRVAQQLAEKDAALDAAAVALDAAAEAIKKQNADNARRIAEAKAGEQRAEEARKVADAAAAAEGARAESYRRKLDAAKRNPDCATLLAIDVAKVCRL